MITNEQNIPVTYSPTETRLQEMVSAHYDNPTLMGLEGEIHFDGPLSAAEVDTALTVYHQIGNTSIPDVAYVPCAGTLRHLPRLKERGIKKTVAVDLSKQSLQQGLSRYGDEISDVTEIHHADIREVNKFAPNGQIPLALLMGNSLGDVTNLDGHLSFIRALGQPLVSGGILVFDYVGDRYNPPDGVMLDTIWPDKMRDEHGSRPVLDRRTRRYERYEYGLGILHLTCEVTSLEKDIIVPQHNYDKLIVSDDLLIRQFAQCSMKLHCLGPLRHHSVYHDRRISQQNDLGMMGEPNHLYVAIKQ